MKKIVSFAASAALSAAISAMPVFTAFASDSSVTFTASADTSPITYTYSSDSNVTSTKSVKELFTSITDEKNVTQNFTVSSQSTTPVKFWLRIAIPEETSSDELPKEDTSQPNADDILDYYKIIIKTPDGEIVYNSDDVQESAPEDTYKDMELLTLNTARVDDSQEYIMELTENGSDYSDAEKLDWLIVSDGFSAAHQSTPSSDDEQLSEVILSAGSYTVGSDVSSGKYYASGDSSVKVYTDGGELKTSIVLTTDEDSKTGVTQCVLNLSDGERIDVTGETKLVPYTLETPSPSSKTSGQSEKNSTQSEKSVQSSPSTEKSNPKTGDTLPLAAIAAGGAAVAFSILLAVIKKRKSL